MGTPPATQVCSPEDLEVRAEQVRAYVVALRGGAPFLSAADGRLLVTWLERGISVAAILSALDTVAEKRRKKQTRSRQSLTACRRLIEKQEKNPRPPTPSGPIVSLSDFAKEVDQMEIPPCLESARSGLVKDLRSIGSHGPEQVAQEGIVACRAFHEAAWLAMEGEHATLRGQALEELAALEGVLNAAALAAAVEEVARDLVRRRTPLVSAKVVWDRVSGSEAER